MSKELTFKTVNQLLREHLYIPYYQRGYRWTNQQVTDLLNDIWVLPTKNGKKNMGYCKVVYVIGAVNRASIKFHQLILKDILKGETHV